ncbi:unnamed protein product [Heterosigma akashiwo]
MQSKTVIEGYDSWGFTIKGVRVEGGVLAFPSHYLLWRPTKFSHLSLEALQPVAIIKPKIEILVLGCGPTIPTLPDREIYTFFKKRGISLEVMNTINARVPRSTSSARRADRWRPPCCPLTPSFK